MLQSVIMRLCCGGGGSEASTKSSVDDIAEDENPHASTDKIALKSQMVLGSSIMKRAPSGAGDDVDHEEETSSPIHSATKASVAEYKPTNNRDSLNRRKIVEEKGMEEEEEEDEESDDEDAVRKVGGLSHRFHYVDLLLYFFK